ncbi:MAG TPA: hypothetical protein VGM21_16355 [Actinomycetota bacterium]|jgi:hypothetical protein
MTPASADRRRGGPRRAAALCGLLAAAAYLAGALASGTLDPLQRRPLLDGLAPRTPYRWVAPPPELAAGNKAPSSGLFEVKLTGSGSQVGAFSTQDTQVTLILGQSAFKASPGQSEVALDVAPLDPAKLPPPPAGMLAAGNAYRIRASYLPSRRQIGTVDGELSLGLVYPLLTAPVADPAGHVVLHSPDGRSWKQLASVDVPGTHQVNAQLFAPGYVLAAVPAGSASGESLAKRALRQAPLVAGVVLLLLAAVFLFRRRADRRLEGDTAEDDGGAARGSPRDGGGVR